MKTDTAYKFPLMLAVLTFCVALSPGRIAAQQHSLERFTAGKTYIIAFPDTTANTRDTRFTVSPRSAFQVFLYSAVGGNTVTITPNGGASSTLTLDAGAFQVVDLNTNPIVSEAGEVSDHTFLIEAESPIIAYCFLSTLFGSEAWTPLPVEAWGKDYCAAALPGDVVMDQQPLGEFTTVLYNPKPAPAEILVIAAYDNTTVTITPRGALTGVTDTTVMLDANQAYLVQSYVDTAQGVAYEDQADLGGSYIHADKAIGVVTGNTRTMVVPGDELTANSPKGMLIESLAPIEQHGTEFVFMPTWDDRRVTGTVGEQLAEKRPAEFARIYGTGEGITNGTFTDSSDGHTVGFTVDKGEFHSQRFDLPEAHVFKTDQPAQGMMNSSSVIRFDRTTGFGDSIGGSYTSWAPYMVEMTPREQWVGFAPFYAPEVPKGGTHYMNVVTTASDSKNLRYGIGPLGPAPEQVFPMNRGAIPGTDLVWGTVEITPGSSYYIRGITSSAKFYGFVYGLRAGYELYRPGMTKKGGSPSTSSAGEKGGASVLHPSEYEEDISAVYGYPLAPSRRTLAGPDAVSFKIERQGKDMQVVISTENSSYAGIRAIELGPGSINTQLQVVSPARPLDLIGAGEAVVKLSPIDPSKAASATLLVIDRTGNTREVAYPQGISGLDRPESTYLGLALETIDPNPLTTTTGIQFRLGRSGHVTMRLYDAVGRNVAVLLDGDLAAGSHRAIWNVGNQSAGVYFCKLQSGGQVVTKMLIVR